MFWLLTGPVGWWISPTAAQFIVVTRDWLGCVLSLMLDSSPLKWEHKKKARETTWQTPNEIMDQFERYLFRHGEQGVNQWHHGQGARSKNRQVYSLLLGLVKATRFDVSARLNKLIDKLKALMIIIVGPSPRVTRARRLKHNGRTNMQISHTSQRTYSKCGNLERRRFGRRNLGVMIVFMAMRPSGAHLAPFGSDSVELFVDNCASRCVTNKVSDFIKAPQLVAGRVKGISGAKVAVKARGTIRWAWEDDEGRAHSFLIPGSLYVPDSPVKLFSPQHWAQVSKDDHPIQDGTWQKTLAKKVILCWGQEQYSRTIEYNSANVATFHTSPGSRKYVAFRSMYARNAIDDEQFQCFNTTVVTDDEDDGDDDASVNSDSWPFEPEGDKPPAEPPPDVRLAFTPFRLPSDVQTSTPENHEEGFAASGSHQTSFDKYSGCDVVPDTDEDTISKKMSPTAELIYWHYKLGHLPFSRLRGMAEEGILPKRLSECRLPKCSACIYGKMTRRPKRTKGQTHAIGVRTVTRPGQCVSVDQLESSTPGLIAQLKGTPTIDRYRCATIYVDHYSRLSFVYLQRTLTSDETVKSKQAFERYCESRGVKVRHYHADNGRFADNGFINDVAKEGQSISYCGVNAHWQNGICEKRIRDLQEQTTTMLLHAESKWKSVIDVHLWPYALRAANDAMNATPRLKDKKIPQQLFADSDAPTVLRHFHTFGCPTYALNNRLAAGSTIPKWHKRARLGVYLGRSPLHAQSVALVLNLSTGLVSPQFHVAFDDFFETVSDHDDYPNRWKEVTHFGTGVNKHSRKKKKKAASTGSAIKTVIKRGLGMAHDRSPNDTAIELQDSENDIPLSGDPDIDIQDDDPSPTEVPDDHPDEEPEPEPPDQPRQKWSRRHTPTQRLKEYMGFTASYEEDYEGEEEYKIQHEMNDPIAFAANSNPDDMYYHEAMKAPDRKQFVEAMDTEVQSHLENKNFELTEIKDLPPGTKVLPSVWAMKRKRRILSREIYKWKARLNLHGGKQEQGVHYWETYAAALKWTSIRFFMIQILINKWHSQQCDFVLAFPQADAECEMYMQLPRGYEVGGSRKTHCLKVLRNLYGGRAASRVWQQFLFKGLIELGFEQSQSDECVFYLGTTIFMVYVDDGIFCGPDKQHIQECIKALKERFTMTDEGAIDEYLGVKVTHLEDNRISLTQPHLIDSIIEDLGFRENTKGKSIPALSSSILHRDLDGEPHDENWDFRSVIGKLNFLEKSTRPDIAYAVHQCARFASNPKATHSAAVRQLVRYLYETKDKGLILNPNDHSFEVYVDAGFVGDWNEDTAKDSVMTAKSRTGFIIMYAGCPITWTSKIQNECALSTTEAEYIALSESAREVLPLMGLMDEVKARMCSDTVSIPTVRCTMFEDNEGALAIANVPKVRPRTKHINTKMHHFRSHVKSGRLLVKSIDTADQLGDIATKPLAEALFVKLRKRIMGW